MLSVASLAEFTSSISVIGSFVAGLYQIYLGYIFEGADGFSPVLLFGWILGDVFNVIGTFWTHQLTFQKIIAIASFSNDVAMGAQHLYYKSKSVRKHDLEPTTPYSSTNFLAIKWNALLRPYILFTLVSAARAYPITDPLGFDAPKWSDDDFEDCIDWWFLIGQGMAWTAELSYVFALVPQALENFSRKSTGSVSIVIFVADAVSSLNYFMTILISSAEKHSHHAQINFLMEELPYLVGMFMCSILDLVLLSQYFFYPQFIAEVQLTDTESEHIVPLVYSRETTPFEGTAMEPFRSWKVYGSINDDTN